MAGNPVRYTPCDRAKAAGWKTFPVRILGPGRSPCHDTPTVLVESMSGGFVTKNCSRCGQPDTLSQGEFGALALPVNCPECTGPMRPHIAHQTPEIRVPTGNYAIRCDGCQHFIELHWMLPKWSDLFTRESVGTGFPDWASGDDTTSPVAPDRIYCANCGKETSCAEVEAGDLPLPPGNYYSTAAPDIQWLRRVRRCGECGTQFVTAEGREEFLDELVELRNVLAGIERHAESSARESRAVAASLNALAGSLEVLLALKVNVAGRSVGPIEQAEF